MDGEESPSAFRRVRLASASAPRTQRRRPRAGTAAAIKKAARDLLAAGGEPALTLRGVARKVGISAPAIYRYYPSLDSLAAALRADLCAELIALVETARDGVREDDPAGRMSRIVLAFHGWALDRQTEYMLLFFPEQASRIVSVSRQELDPGYQVGILFFDECAELWRQHAKSPAKASQDEAFDQYLSPWLRERYPGLPASVMFACLMTWMKLSGLILVEATGYLGPAAAGGGRLLETEVADHVRWLAG
jgi:AcrR family transcriptional regulator